MDYYVGTDFLALCAERAGDNDIPEAANTRIAQALVSKYHAPLKGTRAPWEKWLVLGENVAGRTYNEPGVFLWNQKVKKSQNKKR